MSEYLTDLRTRMSNDLRAAMKARDTVATSALRAALGALDNAGAVPAVSVDTPIVGRVGDVPRKILSEDDCAAVLRREADASRSAAAECERFGRSEEAARARREVEIIERYLGSEPR